MVIKSLTVVTGQVVRQANKRIEELLVGDEAESTVLHRAILGFTLIKGQQPKWQIKMQ